MRLSITGLRLFKACRRAYELKYVEGVTPVSTADALETGRSYHGKLEDLYNTGELDTSDFTRESAMAAAYLKYIYPHVDVCRAEQFLELPISEADSLIGIVDGIAPDGSIVEHKTTSVDIEEYVYGLQWDEQILAYMLLTGARKVYFTICRKPTIRIRKDETEKQFFERMCAWYDDDTESKIRLVEIARTDEEVAAFEVALKRMAQELRTDNWYRNTAHCMCWGRRCEYAPICLNYDPTQEYVGFNRREKDAASENGRD